MPPRTDPVARARVVVVGLGPAGADLLAPVAVARLSGEAPTFLRTRIHPAATAFGHLESFDSFYEQLDDFQEVYERIVDTLVETALASGEVVYGVPGSPLVAERTVELLRERPEIELVVVPALSFVDLAWAALGVDPLETQARIVDATAIGDRLRGPGPILVTQCYSTAVLSSVKLAVDADLLEAPPRVILLHHLGLDDERVVEMGIDDLDRVETVDHLTSVYIPTLRTVGPAAEDLVDLMTRLRAECPWDQRQTHASLTRHLLEEAYEALEALENLTEAIETGAGVDEAYEHAAEELGDVVFQVVFHAHLAAEEGYFDLTQVLDGVRTKLISRHPHVFGDVVVSGPDEVASNWEDLKRAEKGRASVTDGIPAALPSLTRYIKLRRKAAAIGMAEPSAEATRDELRGLIDTMDLDALVPSGDADSASSGPIAEHLGKLLAASAELSRLAGIDPELALRHRADALRAAILDAEGEQGSS